MVKNITMKQNDTYPPLRLQLTDARGKVQIINATAKLHVLNAKGVLIDSPMQVIDPDLGIVEYQWKPEDTANVGKYFAEVQVTYSNGEITTFPNWEHFSITIIKDLI